MSCACIEALTMSYLSGELAGSAAAEVERHLDRCPRCRQHYAEELDLLAALSAGAPADLAGPSFTAAVMADIARLPRPGAEPPAAAEIRFLPWTWLPALAAAVALVVGLGLSWSRTATEVAAAVEAQTGRAAQIWAEGAGHLAREWYETAAAALSSSQSLITQQSSAHETLIRIATAGAAALCLLLIARCRPRLPLPNHRQEELKA